MVMYVQACHTLIIDKRMYNMMHRAFMSSTFVHIVVVREQVRGVLTSFIIVDRISLTWAMFHIKAARIVWSLCLWAITSLEIDDVSFDRLGWAYATFETL